MIRKNSMTYSVPVLVSNSVIFIHWCTYFESLSFNIVNLIFDNLTYKFETVYLVGKQRYK
jgi:hypothetical protein